MSRAKLLVVEDDMELREALSDTLELAGFDVAQADCAETALGCLREARADLVVSDINMPGMNGHELLARLRELQPQMPVLLMTAYGDIASAVAAMRAGAADYLVKPFKSAALVEAVNRYLGGSDRGSLQSQPVAVEVSSQELLQLARRVAVTDSTVLISGESGTGKEVLARYIHQHSGRSQGPFIALNCAAIPENMLEATLFGHEKGAFTGAYHTNPGKFELANGGTILLDEISEMDMGLQAKLLRVLQEREVERVGGKKIIALDVRVIATTNRDLQQEVETKRFREDLFYRLSVFPLQWQPLRARKADIVPLATRMLAVQAAKMRRATPKLSAEALGKLLGYHWPGNVRELDNVIQRALILQQGQEIAAADLAVETNSSGALVTAATQVRNEAPAAVLEDGMKSHEFQLIFDALKLEGGRKNRAAEKLGISPRTLRYKIARMRESGYDLDGLLKAV